MSLRNSSNTSQLPRVLLTLNPGIARQLGQELRTLDTLREKSLRSSDHRRRKWMSQLEERIETGKKIYQRQIKMDDDTRKVRVEREKAIYCCCFEEAGTD